MTFITTATADEARIDESTPGTLGGPLAPATPADSSSPTALASSASTSDLASRPSADDGNVIEFTTFPNVHATARATRSLTWTGIADMLWRAPTVVVKTGCPMLKLATFGEKQTASACYRADDNMLTITGIEGDYDAGAVSMAEARERLERHGVRAIVYSSWSHRPDAPRWRVLCPTSAPLPPEQRAHLVARLNGALGGILAPESFALSLSYFYGRNASADYECAVTFDDPGEGECIDVLDSLDVIACGQPDAAAPTNARATAGGADAHEDWLAGLLDGDDVHGNALRVVGRMVARGLDDEIIQAVFDALYDKIAEARGFERAEALIHAGELDRMIAGARKRGFAPESVSAMNPPSDRIEDCTGLAQLVSAMHAIPEAERAKAWSTVSKALHWETISTADSDAALAALKAWCPDKSENCDEAWASLKGPGEIGVSPISGASILKLAHGHGWKGATSVVSNVNAPWEPPEDLIASTESEPYPLDALPGGIGAAVREVVGFVQCPAALAACSALSALSLAGQALVDVRRSEGLTGPVSLFVLAVAESGERKSSCDGYFTSMIKTWEREKIIAAAPDIARAKAAIASWQAKRDGLLTAIKGRAKGGKPTEELDDQLRQLEANVPMPAFVPFLIYGDATPEALAYGLAREWPSGGVMSAEAGAVFGGHAMTSDSAMRNMSMLNALWSGEEVKIKRRTSESFTVRGARLTMGLAVQPETIRAFYEGSKGLARGIGFSARCLVAWPASTQGRRLFRPAPEAMPAVSAFGRRLAQLLDETPWPDAAGQIERQMLSLSPEAQNVWIAFYDDVERELGHAGALVDVRDVASKAADNAARIAALFHLFESGPDGSVSAEHMQSAAQIAAWHMTEAQRFYGAIALPKVLANAVTLDEWLRRACEANGNNVVPQRDVQRLGPNRVREKRQLEEAVAVLAEAHRARWVAMGSKKLIQVNPALLAPDNGTQKLAA